MKSLLAVLAGIVIGVVIIAIVYFMMMVGWILACAAIILVIASGVYAVLKDWFMSLDDNSDEKNPPK
jgi:uncharacterized oligopeptide transporter (OPT) family protein